MSYQHSHLWIGGHAEAPFLINGESERPHIVMWLDPSQDTVLSAQVVPASKVESCLSTLYSQVLASEKPGTVSSVHVVVPTESLARSVEKFHQGPVSVRPEVQEEIVFFSGALMENMQEETDTHTESYTQEGRLPASLWAPFFKAAKACYQASPWLHADDDQTILLKAPSIGYPEGCISVMGALGEAFGIALFASVKDYETFADAGEQSEEDDTHIPLTQPLQHPVLVVHFEHPENLHPGLTEEIHTHGWVLPASDVYPTLTCLSPDLGGAEPLATTHITAATATLQAVVACIEQHPDMFQYASNTPVTLALSVHTENGPLTYEAVLPHPEASFAYVEDNASDEAIGPAQPSLVQIRLPKNN